MNLPTPSQQAELIRITNEQEKSLYKAICANKNKVFAINAIRQVHQKIDALASRVQKKPGVRFDCRPGCNYCCSLRVEVTSPEVFLIARHLSKMDKNSISVLMDKLKAHSVRAKGLEMSDYYLQCPLLTDGMCSVYEFRPSMCRKFFSLDIEKCKDPKESVPEDMEMYLTTGSITSGASNAYARAKFPDGIYELGQALLVALTDTKAEDRWFKGEDVFEPIPEYEIYKTQLLQHRNY